ncbi:hypothetical protein [Candidatus Babela massiliensis]|uniref:Uncharacterized protein n=1 Tax=Candidatus Babela massiliensis TaxID=673862 RepID=V6DIB6_9BACT|nr:hypothetical protein [Candidatus Babela massiliensis]CDK30668.1 hypothetical protein BABL1_gene_347 [Candidatus Babela massiliensis]
MLNRIYKIILINLYFLGLNSENEIKNKYIYFQPKNLVYQCTKYILNKNIKIEYVNYDLEEYIHKVREIESRELPQRLKELFLTSIEIHSIQDITNSLKLIDKLDMFLDNSDYLKVFQEIISTEQIEYFSLDSSLSIIIKVYEYCPRIVKILFEKEIEILEDSYINALKVNESDIKAKLMLIRIYSSLKFDQKKTNIYISDLSKNATHPLVNILLINMVSNYNDINIINFIKSGLIKNYEIAFSVFYNKLYSDKKIIEHFSETEIKGLIKKVKTIASVRGYYYFMDHLYLIKLYTLVKNKEAKQENLLKLLITEALKDNNLLLKHLIFQELNFSNTETPKEIIDSSMDFQDMLNKISNKELLIQNA